VTHVSSHAGPPWWFIAAMIVTGGALEVVGGVATVWAIVENRGHLRRAALSMSEDNTYGDLDSVVPRVGRLEQLVTKLTEGPSATQWVLIGCIIVGAALGTVGAILALVRGG